MQCTKGVKPKSIGHIAMFHVICYDKNGRRRFSDWANFPFHKDPSYWDFVKGLKPEVESCIVLMKVAEWHEEHGVSEC